jgi:hypothetical protein
MGFDVFNGWCRPVKVKKSTSGLYERGAVGRIHFGFEGDHRAMDQFIDDRGRETFDLFSVLRGKMRQAREHFFDFCPLDIIDSAP